jgi:dipeptidyl-peptidase-4
MYCNAATGEAKEVYTETDKAWIDIKMFWVGIFTGDPTGWEWIKNG